MFHLQHLQKQQVDQLKVSLSNLENQLEKLQQMEDAKFRQQEAQANEAAQRLNNYTAMQAKIDERLAVN